MLKVAIEVVCMLVCRIRLLLEEKLMRNQQVMHVSERNC